MSKKILKWENEILTCKENIKKQNDRIKDLKKMINAEKIHEEVANNKLIADTVRKIYGEVNEDNIDNFIDMLNKNGHTINGLSGRD